MPPTKPICTEWNLLSTNPQEDHEANSSICRHCSQTVHHHGRLDRVIDHLTLCSNFPENLWTARMKESIEKRTKKRNREEMNEDWSEEEQEDFDRLFALMFYMSSLPYAFARSPLLKNVLKKANPHIRIPSPEQLSGKLLDFWFHNLSNATNNYIQSSPFSYVLANDASEDTNKNSIFNFMAISPEKSFLLESIEATGEYHTGKFIEQITIQVMNQHDLQHRVVGFISDNCNTNKASWELLRNDYPGKFMYGCNDHCLHLLAKDITSTSDTNPHPVTVPIAATVEVVKDVSVFFKNHHRPKFDLECLQKRLKLPKLVIPMPIRWCSVYYSILNVTKSYGQVREAMQKESYLAGAKPNQVVSRKKLSEDFAQPLTYDMCLKCLSVLEPITMQIKLYERNATPLSEVLLCFTNLSSAIERNNLLTAVEKQFIKEKIADRKAFIQQNVHVIAMILDPRYTGAEMGITFLKQDECNKFIEGYFVKSKELPQNNAESYLSPSDIKRQLSSFIQFKTTFKSTQTYQQMTDKDNPLHPFHFWYHYGTEWKGLQKLSLRIFSLIGSTAELERSFSSLSFVHTKVRNRLNHDKAFKELFTKHNFKQLEKREDIDFVDFINLEEANDE